SLYLTLLADPVIRSSPACTQSLLLWHGRVALEPADEGAFFFNEIGDRLSYLSPATVKTLKANGSNASVVDSRDSFAVHVEGIAAAIYNHPFPARATAPTSSRIPPEKIKALTDDLNLLTAVQGGAAAILAAIPGGQVGAGAFALGAVLSGGLAAALPYVDK